jgi:AcrR family transcriptional regulator
VITRDRILQTASRLMYENGVGATSVDDVLRASQTSKSQMYRHFKSRDELIGGVVTHNARLVLEREQTVLDDVSTLDQLKAWARGLAELNATHDGAYGCIVGSLANELSATHEEARITLERTFDSWLGLITEALDRVASTTEQTTPVDTRRLAIGLLSALQGGYLLAQTSRDIERQLIGVDMALEHITAVLHLGA